MKYNALMITIVAGIAGLMIAIILVPPFRFESLKLSDQRSVTSPVSQEALLRFNRLTGSAVRLDDGKWISITPSEKTGKLLPQKAVRLVTGRARFDGTGALFSVSIYNGSRYRITGLVLRVKAEAEKPEDGYERLFFEEVDIAPLSEGTASVLITRPPGFKEHTWSINELYGEKMLD